METRAAGRLESMAPTLRPIGGVPAVVLGAYAVRPAFCEVLESGGPNTTWRLMTERGCFALKQRPAVPDAQWLSFQQDVFAHLLQNRFPIEPLVPTNSGVTTFVHDGSSWQLRAFVEGRVFDLGRSSDRAEALRVLASLHKVTRFTTSPTAPHSDVRTWIVASRDALDECLQTLSQCVGASNTNRWRAFFETTLADALPDIRIAEYDALPRTLTHGEFQGNNLILGRHRMASVIDWDSLQVRPRVYDLAVGTLFLARRRRGSFEIDPSAVEECIGTYRRDVGLTGLELRVLVPIVQLYFLPTSSFLRLVVSRPKEFRERFFSWYLPWCAGGVEAARDQLGPIVERVAAAAPAGDCGDDGVAGHG